MLACLSDAVPEKTEVCISVDVEFSIGGAFTRPDLYKPIGTENVHCLVNGRDHGLGFILDTLDEYGLKGTFFTEALQTTYFGDEPMGEIARMTATRGHDVQMHLHPCWLSFRNAHWTERKPVPVDDSFAGRTEAELDEFISTGLDVFSRWGLPRPIALRTGGFNVDMAVYRAMARSGIPIASNIGFGFNPSAETLLHLGNGRKLLEGVLEIPCFSYRALRLGQRSGYENRLGAVTSTGAWEMEQLLWKARRLGVATIVLLTHPFEFIKKSDFRYSKVTINRVNQSRLKRLAAFLHKHENQFEVVTFGNRSQRWLSEPEFASQNLTSSILPSMSRSLENAVSDRVWIF